MVASLLLLPFVDNLCGKFFMVLIVLVCRETVLLTDGFSGFAKADCLEVKEPALLKLCSDWKPKLCVCGGKDGLSTCCVGFIFIGESGWFEVTLLKLSQLFCCLSRLAVLCTCFLLWWLLRDDARGLYIKRALLAPLVAGGLITA